jgi:hypothetical protein
MKTTACQIMRVLKVIMAEHPEFDWLPMPSRTGIKLYLLECAMVRMC